MGHVLVGINPRGCLQPFVALGMLADEVGLNVPGAASSKKKSKASQNISLLCS